MSGKTYLSHKQVLIRAKEVGRAIHRETDDGDGPIKTCYPIPRGGVPAAYAVLQSCSMTMEIVEEPGDADCFIDDLIDSGRTRDKYVDMYSKPFFALFNKQERRDENFGWLVFPWEGNDEGSIEDNIVRLLQYVGEDVERGGLIETPKRVAKAWTEWTSGYGVDPTSILKVFEDGADNYDEMVVVKDLPFYSHCEHHMAPFFGTATIAYIPTGKIVGLSKLSRLLDIYARRLQVQERLTCQIADDLEKHLEAKGVGVVLKARHLCMESRGICKQGHHTVTAALRGVMRTQSDSRAEFTALAL